MSDDIAPPCCDHLPKLTTQELSKNCGNLFRPSSTHSPSLYEEIFDEKRFNDLISDPLLNTGQMDNAKRKNENTPTRTTDRSAENEFNGYGNGNLWNNNSNFVPNNFDGQFFGNGTAGVSSSVQNQPQLQQIPSSQQMPTPNWQNGQTTMGDQAPMTTPVFTPNANPAQRPSFIRVKTEPQDAYISSSEQDREDYNFSEDGSHNQSLTSRGAVYAREYRRKNKNRISKLEQDNDRLWRENESLKAAYNEASAKVNSLGREVTYLRQVLANDSAISNLLHAVVSNTSGLKFQWPLVARGEKPQGKPATATGAPKRRILDGNDPNTTSKQRKLGENDVRGQEPVNEAPGVCLHVNNDLVSVEFCPRCNRDSRRGAGDLE